MKLRKSFMSIIASFLLLGLFNGASRTIKVQAGLGESWGACGEGVNLNGWNPTDQDIPMSYDEDLNQYVITIYLEVGDKIKFRKDNKWEATSVGAGGATLPYGFSNDGGNLKCEIAGKWFFGIHIDSGTYGDGSFGLLTTERAYDVNYYFGDQVIYTEEKRVSLLTSYAPRHISQSGLRLEGWYTDSELTNRFVKGTEVTSDLNLYGNYIVGEIRYIYAAIEPAWASVGAYLWNSEFGNFNAAWPGQAMLPVVGTSNVYYLEVSAEANFDYLIVNNNLSSGATQTINIEFSEDLYDVIINVSNDTEYVDQKNKHLVSTFDITTTKVFLEGDELSLEVIGAEGEEFTYNGGTALTSDVYLIHFVAGEVVVEISTDSALRAALIKEFILANTSCDMTEEYFFKLRDLYDTLTVAEKAMEGMDEVEDRMDYIISVYLLGKFSEPSGSNNITEFVNENGSLLITLIIGAIASCTIVGYYMLRKKSINSNI